MSAAPSLLSSPRACHPSSRPSSHPAAMASRFRTVAGLCLADEQPRAGCSGRLEFALPGGLRGGHAAGLQGGRAAGLRGGYAAEARTSAPGGLEKRLRIVRIQGDGRCLFRALVRPLPLPTRGACSNATSAGMRAARSVTQTCTCPTRPTVLRRSGARVPTRTALLLQPSAAQPGLRAAGRPRPSRPAPAAPPQPMP